MRRRQFISLLGVAAASYPFATRAQQSERMRRVGVLMSTTADDLEGQARIGAFLQGLRQSGWAVPGNLLIDALRAIPTAFANTRRSSLRSRQTSSWPAAERSRGCCYRRLAQYRSCSR